MRDRARLTGIENDREITRADAPRFWYEYQRSVLLALKENRMLNDTQYQYAEEKLRHEFRTYVMEGDA